MNRRIRLTSTLALSVVAGFMVAGTAMASQESPKVATVPQQVSTGMNVGVPAPALRDGYGHDEKCEPGDKCKDEYKKDEHKKDYGDHKKHDGEKKDHDGKKQKKYKHYKKPHGYVHAGDGSLAQN